MKGLASPALLETYTAERQPVGRDVVTYSNELLRNHATVWGAVGMFGNTREERVKANKELSETSDKGRARRKELFDALERHRGEGDSLGIMMNQWYSSSAVHLEDEAPREAFTGNYLTDVLVSTYPGTRVPHAWLSKLVPSEPISTIDLAGKSAFSLFTGHGGDKWKAAARSVGEKLGMPINCYAIGFGLDYTDMYRDWAKKREIDEDGCVLVRPDRYVAWRSKKMISTSCEEKLEKVLRSILSL